MCPFIGGSQRVDGAIALGLAMALVLTLTAGVTQLVDLYVLRPYGLEYLRLFALLLVVGAAVGVVRLALRRFSPVLQRVLGLYFPLVATNCAVLGVALINTTASRSFVAALFYGTGAALGFGLVDVVRRLRERVATADVPLAFRGAPITFVTAGILSLAFMAFTGFARL